MFERGDWGFSTRPKGNGCVANAAAQLLLGINLCRFCAFVSENRGRNFFDVQFHLTLLTRLRAAGNSADTG